jgi:hypothetical protein
MQKSEDDLEEILDLLTVVIKRLVDAPDAVDLNVVKGNHSVLVEVTTATDDRRHVIGRSGRTAQALRTLFGAMFARRHKSFDLKIIEE